MPWLVPTPGGVLLQVRVVPRASRSETGALCGERLKVRLQAPPVEGKANRALVAFVAGALGIPRRNISVVSGEKSRAKTLRVLGIDEATVRGSLT